MKTKITIEDVRKNMQNVLVRTEIEFGKPVTYVTVRMENGFTIRESTTCIDPANYNEETGKKICLEKIEDKIWMLLGYELQSQLSKERPIIKANRLQLTISVKPELLIFFQNCLGGIAFNNAGKLICGIGTSGTPTIYTIEDKGKEEYSFIKEFDVEEFHPDTDEMRLSDFLVITGPLNPHKEKIYIKPANDDCALISDGGPAVILSDLKETLKKYPKGSIYRVISAF